MTLDPYHSRKAVKVCIRCEYALGDKSALFCSKCLALNKDYYSNGHQRASLPKDVTITCSKVACKRSPAAGRKQCQTCIDTRQRSEEKEKAKKAAEKQAKCHIGQLPSCTASPYCRRPPWRTGGKRCRFHIDRLKKRRMEKEKKAAKNEEHYGELKRHVTNTSVNASGVDANVGMDNTNIDIPMADDNSDIDSDVLLMTDIDIDIEVDVNDVMVITF